MMVIGAKGAGKSTLARQISERTGTKHYDLDIYYRRPNGSIKSRSEFGSSVSDIIAERNWIVDGDCVQGDFAQLVDIVWSKASTIVWLDPPFGVVVWRLTYRTLKRLTGRERLWHGHRETGAAVLNRVRKFDAVKAYWVRKRRYAELVRRPEFARLEIVRLRKSAEVQTWLASLGQRR